MIWKRSLSMDTSYLHSLSEVKRVRALRQIETLENMISQVNMGNETEAEHGKFEGLKNKIVNKCRVVESLIGEQRMAEGDHKKEEEGIALAKQMNKQLEM
jgi:hypothetical protein